MQASYSPHPPDQTPFRKEPKTKQNKKTVISKSLLRTLFLPHLINRRKSFVCAAKVRLFFSLLFEFQSSPGLNCFKVILLACEARCRTLLLSCWALTCLFSCFSFYCTLWWCLRRSLLNIFLKQILVVLFIWPKEKASNIFSIRLFFPCQTKSCSNEVFSPAQFVTLLRHFETMAEASIILILFRNFYEVNGT